MTRLIQLALSKIRYGGNSIGDDIRVEVEILGNFLRLDRRIKPNTTANINFEIGKFTTDRNVFEAKIGHSGERYLHTGGRSLGCITIVETKRWIEIYNAFIKARKGDFMSVGVLTVVD